MKAQEENTKKEIWSRIESEKQKDKTVRRITMIAWGITLLAVLAYAIIVFMRIEFILEATQEGFTYNPMHRNSPVSMIMPLVAVIGGLALLVAILSTIGMFLRMRTSGLQEIQMRLAALEELIISEREEKKEE